MALPGQMLLSLRPTEAHLLKQALSRVPIEPRLLPLLANAHARAPTSLHAATLRALQTYLEGWPAGARMRDAGGVAMLHSLLRAWVARHAAAVVAAAAAEASTDAGGGGGASGGSAIAASAGGAPLLPQLLLVLQALAAASDAGRAAMVRAGFVETLMRLLDGPLTPPLLPPALSEAPLLAVRVLGALELARLDELCEGYPERLEVS